jgi:hypothetical protein
MAIYVSAENQKLLWNVLHKNQLIYEVFPINENPKMDKWNKTIKEQWFKSIIEIFYNQNRYKTISKRDLQKLNQDTLSFMIEKLRDHNSKQNKKTLNNIDNQDTTIQKQIETPPIQLNTREEILSSQFNQLQKDYQQMNEKKSPESIDFRDKLEDEPISNMDQLIKSHMEMRENELKMFAPPPPIPQNQVVENQIQLKEVNPVTNFKNTTTMDLSDKYTILQKQISELIEKMNEMQNEITIFKSQKNATVELI